MSGVTIEADSTVEVGDQIAVRIRRPEDGPKSRVRALVVALVCVHDCKAIDRSRQSETYATNTIDVADGRAVDEIVHLGVPLDAPISFTGSLIRNRWKIEVTEDIVMGRDKMVQWANLLVAPKGGLSIYTKPHPLR